MRCPMPKPLVFARATFIVEPGLEDSEVVGCDRAQGDIAHTADASGGFVMVQKGTYR